jgi:hypothetical protein
MSEQRLSARQSIPFRALLTATLAAAALILAACRPSGLPDDGAAPTVSQEAAVRLMRKAIVAAQTGATTGQSTLTITDDEATSFLSLGPQLSEQMQSIRNATSIQDLKQIEGFGDLESAADLEQWQQLLQKPDGIPNLALPNLRLTIQEPQVYFKGNGHVVVRGYGELSDQRQPIRAVIAPRTDDGELVLDFVEGQLGSVPLPEPLFDLIGKGLAQVLLMGQDYVRIQDIRVDEDELTVTGRTSLLGG